KSLYGLKQAPRAWFQLFAGYATRVGFYHSRCDSFLFILRQGSQVAYLLIYVDGIIFTASSTYLLQQVITSLHNEFDMTSLGALNCFLGISATRHSTGLFLSQKQYAIELLAHAHMTNCNPSRTSVDTDSKLGPEGVLVQDPILYRSLAGGIQYLTFTRPDISYARHMSANPVQHQRTKHIESDIHFVRDLVTAGQVRVLDVPSRYHDGEEYVVIRLETSPKDEDGVLVYARRFDLYLLAFWMKNHSIFQFKVKLVANGSGFGFADDYRSLGGLTNVQVGVNAFNCPIQRLLKYFHSDDDNLLMWKKEITQICVFVSEATRNKYVLYDRYKRIEGSVSLWSPLLIRSWKSFFKKGYEHDHDIVVEKYDAEWELIDCLKEFDANIVDKNYGKIEASSLVCDLMLSLKWDHLAKNRIWVDLDPILKTHKKGLELITLKSILKVNF
nr:ribonuclease H-like domain-containing protein [Tanacetum cinerariifolium]